MTDKLTQNPQPELSEHDAELLSAYIDEMLSADEKAELEARLFENVFLRNELSAMRQTVAWMNALPALKAPRNFTISAADIAPAEKTPERKLIPMQNRNLWYLASAAAIVIVLVGFGVVFSLSPSNSGAAMRAGDSSEGIALSATQIAPQDGEAPLESLDTADNTDTALFSDYAYDIAEQSAESSVGLANPANASEVQAPVPPADSIASSSNTSRSINDNSIQQAEAPQLNLQLAQATLADLSSVAQGSGAAIIPGSATQALAVMSDADTGIVAGADSEALADTHDEANDDLIETDGTVENEASEDAISEEIEPVLTKDEPSNLIQAVLNAVRLYAESKRQ